MGLISKFNEGGLTSTDINREFNDEFVSKIMVEQAPRKRTFTGLGDQESIPKHYGDVLTKIVHFPMLHKDNLNDQGLDASTAEIITATWYSIDPSTGAVTGEFAAVDYIGEARVATPGETDDKVIFQDAIVLAQAALASDVSEADIAAAVAAGKAMSSAGKLLWGDASFAAASEPLAPLPEEGGIVNLLNSYSKVVSAKITKHGIAHKYTVDSVDLGSLIGQIGRKIKDVSRAKKELQEMQVQNSLLAQGELNSMVASDVALTRQTVGPTDIVDYDSLTVWEQALQDDDVPMDTKILTGSTNERSTSVEDAYVVYIARAVVPALRRMTGPGGVNVWYAKSKYAAGVDLIDGEVGMIDGLSFRFVVVPDMQKYQGGGLLAVATDDAYATAAGVADKATYDAAAQGVHTSGTNIDVFPMLVVGDDSFVTTSIDGRNTKATHIMPKADVHNDIYGEVGGVSCQWRYGFLCYRTERISVLFTAASRV